MESGAGVTADATENRREALNAVLRLDRLLLSVAAGTVVLSGTLLQTIYVGRSLLLLEIAWVALGISLVVGYLVHGRYIAQLDESNLDSRGLIEFFSLVQALAVLVGLALFGVFVAVNVESGPRLALVRAELGPRGRYISVTVDCRSGAGSGCRGEAIVAVGRKLPHEIGRGRFAADSDGPMTARVALRRREGASLASGRAIVLRINAIGTGRFGNQTEAGSKLLLRRPRPPYPSHKTRGRSKGSEGDGERRGKGR